MSRGVTRGVPTGVTLLSILLAAAGAAGCVEDEGAPDLSEQALPIIGGNLDTGDPAVIFLSGPVGSCSGTLIEPTVVLTAAHCIFPGQNSGTVSFGNALGDFFDSRPVVDTFQHRFYDDGLESGFDVALVRLNSAAPEEVEPVPYNTAPIGDDFIDAELRVVGFGYSEFGNEQSFGTKRQAALTIRDVQNDFFVIGDQNRNTCQGDSGGPSFISFDGVEKVVAVTSFGQVGCAGQSKVYRVDPAAEIIDEVVSAWSGPCATDGDCVETGCGDWPDPDCDICGFDGFCGTGCPRVDLDCPKGGLSGDSCENDDGCESRVCAKAPEDSRVEFCSEACDPASTAPNFGCVAPLSLCADDGSGRNVCLYDGITPSTQGAPCQQNGDCRSEICDADASICVEPCGDGCSDEYTCLSVQGVDSCTIDQGDCALAGARQPGRGLLWVGVLLATAAFALRRRRSRPRG
jgi:V8-like Glu-specific endopeptidase